MLITVPQAARKVGRNPETVRRWIRAGRLRAQKIGSQNLIDDRDLRVFRESTESAELPKQWLKTFDGEPQLDWVELTRVVRDSH